MKIKVDQNANKGGSVTTESTEFYIAYKNIALNCTNLRNIDFRIRDVKKSKITQVNILLPKSQQYALSYNP